MFEKTSSRESTNIKACLIPLTGSVSHKMANRLHRVSATCWDWTFNAQHTSTCLNHQATGSYRSTDLQKTVNKLSYLTILNWFCVCCIFSFGLLKFYIEVRQDWNAPEFLTSHCSQCSHLWSTPTTAFKSIGYGLELKYFHIAYVTGFGWCS